MKAAIAMMLCLYASPDEWTIDESVPKAVVEGEIVSMDDAVVTIAFDVDPDALPVLAARGDTVVDGKWIRTFQSGPSAEIDPEQSERMVGRRAKLTLRRTLSGRLLVIAWRPAG